MVILVFCSCKPDIPKAVESLIDENAGYFKKQRRDNLIS